ncbi:DedA family protein [Saccharothrix longispora]|uniref:DedA family protein n=1 Tax=Saccharothrix longispora TaxID=33920 RepID=UPI0028FD2C17|nr:VTT domain-containing protein [Saccharothrix longispora]MBY8849727.1 VTT domain-containing protein [Saccharothrix sp. MB29]MDU0293395.1 VTT domain-containing protein [Saccharothrix longispora]
MGRVTVTPLALGPDWLDPQVLLAGLGPYMLVGLCFIVFAECGLLVGFFLPGDSLLFTAGMFVATGLLDYPLWLVCVLLTACAMLGNVVGYYIGYRAGPALFSKPESKIFKKEYVDKTEEFFDKYGARAIVMARFVPIVRTFITAMAGVGRMDRRKYFTYSFIGGIAWAAGITVLGYFLGQIPFVRDNIEMMLILIVLISVVPIVIEVIKARREKKSLLAQEVEDVTQVIDRVDDFAEEHHFADDRTQQIRRID